jgi:hypothetical protein
MYQAFSQIFPRAVLRIGLLKTSGLIIWCTFLGGLQRCRSTKINDISLTVFLTCRRYVNEAHFLGWIAVMPFPDGPNRRDPLGHALPATLRLAVALGLLQRTVGLSWPRHACGTRCSRRHFPHYSRQSLQCPRM